MPPENSEQGRWFAEHLLPHEAMLRSWLNSRFPTGLDINDVIQEAYLRVLKARDKGQIRAPKAFLFAIVGAEHILQLLPAGTHEYDKFIKPSELAGWIRDAGLILEDQTGLTYNPITRNYRLNPRDVSVNYMVHAVKPA